MAKLEELSELLVSEIRDFEKAVKCLEKVQETKINIDLTELMSVLSNHEMELKNQNLNVKKAYDKFESLIKEAKIYPKWAVIVFMVSLILNFIIIAYLVLMEKAIL